MVKTVHITRWQRPETWRYVVTMSNPMQIIFYPLRFKNDGFISKRDLGM